MCVSHIIHALIPTAKFIRSYIHTVQAYFLSKITLYVYNEMSYGNPFQTKIFRRFETKKYANSRADMCWMSVHFFYLHMAWPHFEIWLKNCPVMSVVDLISKAWVDQGTCFCKELEHLIWIHWSSRIISFMQLYNPQLFWRKLWPSCSKTICCLSTKVL